MNGLCAVLSFLFSLLLWHLTAVRLLGYTHSVNGSLPRPTGEKERKKKKLSSSSSSITETRNYQLVVTRANPFSFLASRFDLKLFVCWLLSVVVFFSSSSSTSLFCFVASVSGRTILSSLLQFVYLYSISVYVCVYAARTTEGVVKK